MGRVFTFLLRVVFGLHLILFFGCSEPEPDIPPTKLQTENSSYSSFDFVVINLPSTFSAESIPAEIGGYSTALEVTGNTAVFVLPDLNNGSHLLSFSNGKIDYEVEIKVVNIQSYAAADIYFEGIVTPIEEKIKDLNSTIEQLNQGELSDETETLTSDLQKYSELLEFYKAEYADLSDYEKTQFARFMETHSDFLAKSTTESSFKRTVKGDMLKVQSTEDYEAEIEVSMLSFSSQVIFTVAHIPATLILIQMLSLPNPYIQGGAAIGAGIVVTSFFINASETATAAAHLTRKAIKPFEIMAESAQAKFESGKEIILDITANYRSMISSDTGSDTSVIQKIAQSYEEFREKFNLMRSRVPERFKPAHVITSLKENFSTSTRNIYNQYIKISNVDNPDVQVEKINLPDGSYKIKATTALETNQEFQFDIEYTNGKFAKNLKKNISGIIEVVDSISIYTANAIGTWSAKSLTTGTISIFELYPDGTGKYLYVLGGHTYPNGGYNIGWSILKRDGRYFLEETGFWHPGYTSLRVIDSDLPLAALSYPIDFYFHYTDHGEGPVQSILYTKL